MSPAPYQPEASFPLPAPEEARSPWYREPPRELTLPARYAWERHMEARHRLLEALRWRAHWHPSWWDHLSGRVAENDRLLRSLMQEERAQRDAYLKLRIDGLNHSFDRLEENSRYIQECVRELQTRVGL